VHERLATAMGAPGCLSVFGRKAVQHRLPAEHLTADYPICTEGWGRTVDEWKLPAHRPDNHWFGCVVGCAAAAPLQGASASAQPSSRRATGNGQTYQHFRGTVSKCNEHS